jgi:monoamine oxidase
MADTDVLIIGAGAAGLAAAETLTRASRRVTILEARDRIGGRIHTLHSSSLPVPIELGAEFIHGEPHEILDLAGAHGLTTYPVADEHDVFEQGTLRPVGAFWSRVERVLHGLDVGGEDRPVAKALEPRRRSKAGQWASRYVEGFHAADLATMSVRALARSEGGQASGSSGAARLLDGYDALAAALASELHGPLVDLRLRVAARDIRWTPGQVSVATESPEGVPTGSISARAVIVTVPLGVLQAPDSPGGIRLTPTPDAWFNAMRVLRMGSVLRLVLQFRRAPWPRELGFLHVPGARIPTWWTPAPIRAPMITGWAGGPSADALLALDRQELVAAALDVLAPAIGTPRSELGGLLVDSHHHQWSADPLSRGAYSHALVGGADAFEALGEPVAGTLVAAGEATAGDGENGTVQGAIASGRRAAEALLAGLPAA